MFSRGDCEQTISPGTKCEIVGSNRLEGRLLEKARVFPQTICLAMVCALTSPLYAQVHADRIIVHKKEHTLELIHSGRVIKTYKIALGHSPVGPKQKEGDFRTPEGVYIIDSRNAKSQYHRSLHISYPDAADRAR